MGRQPRPTTAGIYHVFARAAVDEKLFRDEHDFLRFETEVRAVVSDSCRCLAACALTTHYHLLLEVEDGVLTMAMKRLNQAYARAFNARYGRRGHAFAERYGCEHVCYDEQLLNAYRYVARNPVGAGLCSNPADWRWSSYTTLVGRGDRFAFADPQIVIEVCGSIEALCRLVDWDGVEERLVAGVRHPQGV